MRQLPARPNLEHLKDQAKALLDSWKSGDPEALERIAAYRFSEAAEPALNNAQLVLAREYGFASWAALKEHVANSNFGRSQAAERLVRLACLNDPLAVRRETLQKLLEEHPDLESYDLSLACLLGNADFVRGAVANSPRVVKEKIGVGEREPLLYACFSWFLKNAPERREGIRSAARILLENGADPNVAFTNEYGPMSALYGASGYSGDVEMTRILMEAGADPNDNESLYHSAEHPGPALFEVLFQHEVAEVSKAQALFRKLDFDDLETVRWLLDHGVSPNVRWPVDQATPLMQCLNRGRRIEFLELLLERGADPNLSDDVGQTPYRLAKSLGRADAAKLLAAYGARTELGRYEQWVADVLEGREAGPAPSFEQLGRSQRDLLSQFASRGEVEPLQRLLDAGFPQEMGLWSTPLHASCWHGKVDAVRMLLARGVPLEICDPIHNGTPFGWAMHGSVHCKASPPEDYVEIVSLLAEAGAELPKAEDSWWREEHRASPEVRAWLVGRYGKG